ncbi:thiamine pyrophosphate-binding protein [Amycolatopsis pithecellobii]|uniref:Thiamine pyrophosphate-binding protein n=1 Tax=Amycolatopsis pithecellobii TaxID=664692 RepID=A0A6N7Z114_9PSEU|nr:thiamine pyrophosphate-binding protein [Amycolatopsis pithecellobii]MTD58008.1 hypothetical protein [Amycolatopsis pithecellobii]
MRADVAAQRPADSTPSTGADALVAQLAVEGITDVFGVPGVQLDHALDAIARAPGAINYWSARHEQGAAYMADGYARATGRIGTCMVVPGPGVLNAMAGLATAYACSSPVLCLAGQIPSRVIGQGLGILHEIPDQDRVLASVSKLVLRANSPDEIPRLVHEAVAHLRSGRPRPVTLELPPDVLAAGTKVELIDPIDVMNCRPVPESADIARFAEALTSASRPIIYAGWGVQSADATEQLTQLAERLGAPVVMSRNGRGSIAADHPLALPGFTARRMLAEADVVLVVGSRFIQGSGAPIGVASTARLLLLNADASDLGPPRTPTATMQADAKLGLEALIDAMSATDPDPTAARTWPQLTAIRGWAAEQVRSVLPQSDFVDAIRAAVPDDGVLVNELTQVGYLAGAGYPVRRPRTYLTPGYQGTLGYGYATSLGVKVGVGHRAVVSITGDGGFGWTMSELATAANYNIASVVVVFNDNAFGNVRRIQAEEFGGRFIADSLTNPDYLELAASFGVAASRVRTPGELQSRLASALSTGRPYLIEVPVESMPSAWHLLLDGPATAARG